MPVWVVDIIGRSDPISKVWKDRKELVRDIEFDSAQFGHPIATGCDDANRVATTAHQLFYPRKSPLIQASVLFPFPQARDGDQVRPAAVSDFDQGLVQDHEPHFIVYRAMQVMNSGRAPTRGGNLVRNRRGVGRTLADTCRTDRTICRACQGEQG